MKRTILLLVSTVYHVAARFRIRLMGLWGVKARPVHVTLYYHDITRRDLPAFAAQMDLLATKAVPVAPHFRGPFKSGRTYVCITFDDGYPSIIRYVVPLMKQRRIPFTCFIPAGYLGKNCTWEGGDERLAVMDEDDIRRLPADLVTIGSHTLSHRDVASLSRGAARNELARSKRLLENITGHRVRALSFPYSSCTASLVEMARHEGYDTIFTGQNEPCRASGPGELTGRIAVAPDDTSREFALKVSGAYGWLHHALRFKRYLRGLFRTSPTGTAWKNRVPAIHDMS